MDEGADEVDDSCEDEEGSWEAVDGAVVQQLDQGSGGQAHQVGQEGGARIHLERRCLGNFYAFIFCDEGIAHLRNFVSLPVQCFHNSPT